MEAPLQKQPIHPDHDTQNSGANDDEAETGGGVRKRWATARERNRMKARYAIQQRVYGAQIHTSHHHEPEQKETSYGSKQWNVPQILHRIIQGDTAFFSLQFMEEHFLILNEPFPSHFLWEINPENAPDSSAFQPSLLNTVRLRSRLGLARVTELERYASELNTCTVLEFAVWLQRYRIIRQLILGGIDPIVQSLSTPDPSAKQLGVRVQQLFCAGAVPLSLSSYIVARVIGLRQSTWCKRDRQSLTREPPTECQICGVSKDWLLQWNGDDDTCPCAHQFCEACIWNDILKDLDHKEGDVVRCPICHQCENDNETITTTVDEIYQIHPLDSKLIETRRQLYQQSLANYFHLPIDSVNIKKISSKKKILPECQAICATWSDAVKPFIGATQTSRRDKFFLFVEKGSYHRVKAYIEQGIDLNTRNEYGQTAFFLAVWQHNIPLVRLLLYHGGNPDICANGGISSYHVAKHYGYTTIIDMFETGDSTRYANDTSVDTLPYYEACHREHLSTATITTLIDRSVDHPGAGSCIVDQFMEDSFIDALYNLWNMLPEELGARKKLGPCSERRYYCDVYGMITSTICAVLWDAVATKGLYAFQQISCGPLMRFLHYTEAGAVLAPHIDLSRTDLRSAQRSTHSFLLYLSTCSQGGETALLNAVTGEGRHEYLATVAPQRGRLLIFPHRCPHEGLVVVDTPKMLIRGELWMS